MPSTVSSERPANRYAAERSGLGLHADSRPQDRHSGRRRSHALLAGLFLLVNLCILAALAPQALTVLRGAVTLPALFAPNAPPR